MEMSKSGVFRLGVALPRHRWRVGVDEAFRNAWTEFCAWMTARGINSKISKFNLTVLAVKKRDDFPCMQCKASDCAALSEWLAERIEEEVEKCDVPLTRLMATMLEGFRDLWDLCREA